MSIDKWRVMHIASGATVEFSGKREALAYAYIGGPACVVVPPGKTPVFRISGKGIQFAGFMGDPPPSLWARIKQFFKIMPR